MASANRAKRQERISKGAGSGFSDAELGSMLDEVPFLDDTAPPFTGSPTIGGFGVITGPYSNVARTVTADGTGTGTVAAAGRLQVVVVTSDDANKILVLPAPSIGTIIVILNGTTGYELRSSDPATIGINGGTGAGAESAIPASTTVIMVCESLTNWKGLQLSSTAGTLAKVEVAA